MVVAILSLGHHDFFWFSKSVSSKDKHNHSHYIIMMFPIIFRFCDIGIHTHTNSLPQPPGTYHRVLHSVNQLNDICSTTKVLQNLNLSFYLLFLHWLKYTRVIRSKTPLKLINKTLKQCLYQMDIVLSCTLCYAKGHV